MRRSRFPLWRSTPLRLGMALVVLFSLVSLASLGASFLFTQHSFDQALRDELRQDMTGFRATPTAAALATLVKVQARETNPERMVLSYLAPNGQHFGNAAIGRDAEGYHILSADLTGARISGRFLTLTEELHGGLLTIARSYTQIESLARVFTNILFLSLLPTIIIAISGAIYLSRRTAKQVHHIENTLEKLTTGQLTARTKPTSDWANDFAQIGHKVDQMAQAHERSVDSLRQVSTDIAHDLKTPIQRVVTYLDSLAELDDLMPPAQALVAQSRSELENTVTVFHALLQLAQIEAGTPRTRFETVDLADLCQMFFEVYEPATQDAGHALNLDLPTQAISVEGDRALLGQIIANLLENAIRHSGANAEITLGLGTSPDENSGPELWVRDTGQGIPEDEHGKVLRRLYRLDRSRNTAGNGLGLSLVESVAKLHGATLTMENMHPGFRVALHFPVTTQPLQNS